MPPAECTEVRSSCAFPHLVQDRALLGQAPLFWSSLAPPSVAAIPSAAAGGAQQGAGTSQLLVLTAPALVASSDEAAAGTQWPGSVPSSHRLQAEAGAGGAASDALLAASQAFYQVHGGIQG